MTQPNTKKGWVGLGCPIYSILSSSGPNQPDKKILPIQPMYT